VEATALSTDLTEARSLIQIELSVITLDGEQLISGLVDCAATLDFVSEDFVRHFSLQTHKSKVKTLVQLTNGQRVTSSTVCEITYFELARHEFKRNFYVLRDVRVAGMVLGLPWLNGDQASLQFCTTRVFTLMDGAIVEIQTKDRRP
jgi:hypothetical protein